MVYYLNFSVLNKSLRVMFSAWQIFMAELILQSRWFANENMACMLNPVFLGSSFCLIPLMINIFFRLF